MNVAVVGSPGPTPFGLWTSLVESSAATSSARSPIELRAERTRCRCVCAMAGKIKQKAAGGLKDCSADTGRTPLEMSYRSALAGTKHKTSTPLGTPRSDEVAKRNARNSTPTAMRSVHVATHLEGRRLEMEAEVESLAEESREAEASKDPTVASRGQDTEARGMDPKSNAAEGGWQSTGRRRVAPDGGSYTKAEFRDYYGGLSEWNAANKGLSSAPKAADGDVGDSTGCVEVEAGSGTDEALLARLTKRGNTDVSAGADELKLPEGTVGMVVYPATMGDRHLSRAEAEEAVADFVLTQFEVEPKAVRPKEIYDGEGEERISAATVWQVLMPVEKKPMVERFIGMGGVGAGVIAYEISAIGKEREIPAVAAMLEQLKASAALEGEQSRGRFTWFLEVETNLAPFDAAHCEVMAEQVRQVVMERGRVDDERGRALAEISNISVGADNLKLGGAETAAARQFSVFYDTESGEPSQYLPLKWRLVTDFDLRTLLPSRDAIVRVFASDDMPLIARPAGPQRLYCPLHATTKHDATCGAWAQRQRQRAMYLKQRRATVQQEANKQANKLDVKAYIAKKKQVCGVVDDITPAQQAHLERGETERDLNIHDPVSAGGAAQRVCPRGTGPCAAGSRASPAAGVHREPVLRGAEADRMPQAEVPVRTVLQEMGVRSVRRELDPNAEPYVPSSMASGGRGSWQRVGAKGGGGVRRRSERARARGGRGAGARQRAQVRRNASRRSGRRRDRVLRWGLWCVETFDVESAGWLKDSGREVEPKGLAGGHVESAPADAARTGRVAPRWSWMFVRGRGWVERRTLPTRSSCRSGPGRKMVSVTGYGRLIFEPDGGIRFRKASQNQKQRVATRRFYERKDLLHAQCVERHPGPSARKAPTRVPECPCSASTGARLMAAGGIGRHCRYTYCCDTCDRWFAQIPPSTLRPTQSSDAKYVNTKASRAAAAAIAKARADGSNTHLTAFGGPFRGNRKRYVGDALVGFHNCQGKFRRDHTCLVNYLNMLMQKGSMWGVCEMGIDEAMQKVWLGAETDPKAAYRVIDAPAPKGSGHGSGVALIISKRLDVSNVNVVARGSGTREGKMLAVEMSMCDQQLLVIVTHLSSKDRDQQTELRDLCTKVPAPRQGQAVIWLGDFNFAEVPSIDCLPAQTQQKHPLALEAFNEACEHFGGLVDVFRLVHGEVPAVTHRPGKAEGAERRIDRMMISPVLATGLPGLVDAQHVTQIDMSVLNQSRVNVKSDHAAVTARLRFSDAERPRALWRYRASCEDMLAGNERVKKAIAEATSEAEASGLDGKGAFRVLQEKVTAECKAIAKEQRSGHYLEEAKLKAKFERLEKRKREQTADADGAAKYACQARRCERQLATLKRKAAISTQRAEEIEAFMHEDRGGRSHFAPLRKAQIDRPITRMTDRSDGNVPKEHTTQKAIEGHLRERWSELFNLDVDLSKKEQEMEEYLAPIRDDPKSRLTQKQQQALGVNEIFSVRNIIRAIKTLKAGTAAGRDGLSIDFYQRHAAEVAPALQKLFMQLHAEGKMTKAMREAVITLLYKGKGERDDWARYRPVSVTAIEYRILGRAMHLKLVPALGSILGEPQVGFILGRIIDDDIMCVTELAHYLEQSGRGGLFVMADNVKAYDRVQWPFLQKVLEAFGFPAPFRELVAMLFVSTTSCLKINGRVGESFGHKNGVRQGCCIAPALYVLVQEALLRKIREDPQLEGVMIPGPRGEMEPGKQVELRERAFADDTGVALRDDSQVRRLFELFEEFEAVSGHKLNPEKTIGIRFGTAKQTPAPAQVGGRKVEWYRYGDEVISEKYLGIKPAPPEQVGAQWEAKIDAIEAESNAAMQRGAPKSVYGRNTWVKGVLAAKAWYPFRFQVPPAHQRKTAFERLQKVVNRGMFGQFKFVRLETAKQDYADGGLRHLDVRAHVEAEWVKKVRSLAEETGVARPWKNFWWHGLRNVYGTLEPNPRLVTSTCAFELVRDAPKGAVSELQRAAFKAWGELNLQPMERLQKEPKEPVASSAQACPLSSASVLANALVVYPDGSYDSKSGRTGSGAVIVEGGDADADEGARPIVRMWAPAPRRGKRTNNTAELRAGLMAIRWLLRQRSSRPVVMRFDSKYAEDVAGGRSSPTHNRLLAQEVRRAWVSLHKQRKGEVGFRHVDGHSDHKWNDEADRLAKLAAMGGRGIVSGGGAPTHRAAAQQPAATRRHVGVSGRAGRREFDTPWTHHEACALPIFFDVRSSLRRRGVEMERAAIEWAEAGLRTLSDVLHVDGTRLASRREFETRHADLDGALWAEMAAAVPDKVKEAIGKGAQKPRAGEWVQEGEGIIGEVLGTYGSAVAVREWTVCERTGLLSPVERAGRLHLREQDVHRIVVREEKAPKASSERVVRIVSMSLSEAPCDLHAVGVEWAKGLVDRKAVSVADLSVSTLKEMSSRKGWQMPRTFEQGGVHAYLTDGLDEDERQAEVADAFRLAKATCLPRYIRETKYKVLVSGFLMGARKQRGDCRCKWCEWRGGRVGTRGVCQDQEEDVSHTFADCPRAREVWVKVLRWWERCTGERLNADDKRVTLLGSRKHTWMNGATSFECLDEPFAIMHGVALEELRIAREYSRGNAQRDRPASEIATRVQKRFAGLANARMGQVAVLNGKQHPSAQPGKVNSWEIFESTWVASGLAKRVRGMQHRLRLQRI